MTRTWFSWLLCLVLASPALAGNVYVFTDENGRTLFQDSISPELARYGYRVVNEQGITLKVVPPSDKPARPESHGQRVIPHLVGEKNRDRSLLYSFTSVADIERARDKKLQAIDDLISITRSNNEAFERNLDSLIERADFYRSRSENVPDKLKADIEMVSRRIYDNHQFIKSKQEEKEVLRQRYALDIQRFRELKSVGQR